MFRNSTGADQELHPNLGKKWNREEEERGERVGLKRRANSSGIVAAVHPCCATSYLRDTRKSTWVHRVYTWERPTEHRIRIPSCRVRAPIKKKNYDNTACNGVHILPFFETTNGENILSRHLLLVTFPFCSIHAAACCLNLHPLQYL